MPSAWPIASRPVAPLDDPGGDARELRELGGRDHAGRSRADDEHVDLVGQLLRTVEPDARGGLDARVAGDVSVVVELHQSCEPSLNPATSSSLRV